MASPIFTAIINQAGRTIYRGLGGRFISKKTFERGSLAHRVMAEIGPPIGGGDWVSRVRQSSQRFIDIMADDNQLG